MRKRMAALLALLLWALPTCAGAVSVGDVVGHIYSTDITAYVDGMLIPSCNIGGKTAVIAEDLASYGFEVVWDGENRTLSVTAQEAPAEPPVPVIPEETRVPGRVIGDIYATDIKVDVNGIPVTAYNIGGKTAIAFAEIGGNPEICVSEYSGQEMEVIYDKYGSAIPTTMNDNDGYTLNRFRTVWDGEARVASLEVLRKGSFVEVDGNRYRIREVDILRGHGTMVTMSYYDANGDSREIGMDIGIMNSSGGYFPKLLLRQAFEDRWTWNDGRLVLDLRGEYSKIAEYNPVEPPVDAYTLFYFAANGGSPTLIPYITIPATVIRADGETMCELEGAVYRGRILIDMDTFLPLL